MSVSSDLLRENSRDLLRDEEPSDDEIESPVNDDDEEFPTTSMRVVLVDSDPNFLRLTKNLMTEFSYQVTVFINGGEAIAFLMKNKHEVDLVIWDYNVADINGLEALSTIGKEMDLPVAIMSHDHEKETVMKSTKYGACHFLVKPVSKEVTAVLWQHVYRKRMSKSGLDSVESDREEDCGLGQDNKDLYQSNEEGSKNVEDSEEQNNSNEKGERCKKQRMTWTPELHHKFEKAIEQIGSVEKAVPKQILKCMKEEMNVEGLTRNNVASHLQRLRWQKYRQNAERIKPSVPQETREDSSWRNDGSNTALAASKPLLNSSFNLNTRVPYFTNDQAAAISPMQYPSRNYPTMNNSHFMSNPLANLPYTGTPYQQQQQYLHQPYYHSSLQSPSVIPKQDPAYASAATETPDLITNQNSPFLDLGEYFPPGLGNFDPTNRY